MENYKVALSGDLGSGKSTVTKRFIEKYAFETFSTGSYQREIACKMGMTTLELNRYAETHPEIDADIDGKLAEIGKMPGNYIFDSRMAWHFIPDSFKVYLICDPDTAAKRIMNDGGRGNVEKYTDAGSAKRYIMNRRESEKRRYKEKYGVTITDMDNYDLALDVSGETVENITEIIYNEMISFYRSDG